MGSSRENDSPAAPVRASRSTGTGHVGHNMLVGGVYRDRNGVEVEYVSVPLPTHEVTEAVPLDARRVGPRVTRKAPAFYAGTDGAELVCQPRAHRKQWTEEQWIAFREFQQLEADLASTDAPIAAAMIIKT